MRKKPDLMFLKSTDSVGFTAAGIAGFRDINPSSVVRELIQNSLDAAQDADEPKTVVRFSTATVRTRDIPGIGSYRSAFKKAVKRRTEENGPSDQEMMIVEAISHALNRDEQDVLIVSDNGIGLNETRMHALLSDGVSSKERHASGAFGVGHMSVFPLSELRYVLYGGICGGRWTASGHAVLASHDANSRDRTGRSANGYYLAGSKGRKHIYPGKRDLPPLVQDALSGIERSHRHGTAVIVPAFNRFKEKVSLREAVSEAVACSFFPAVAKRSLEVVVEDSGESWTLTSANLESVLHEHKEKKQSRGYLAGQKAFFSHAALLQGERHTIHVLDGSAEIVVRHPADSGTTRINLFRNGMWITNSDRRTGGIPRLHSAFPDHEPFEALILVSAQSAPEFHGLIRNAEGATHNRLDLKLLTNEDEKQLRGAFEKIRQRLGKLVPKFSDQPYSPSDFLVFGIDGNSSSGPKAGWSYGGALIPIHRRTSGQRSVDAGLGGRDSRGKGGGGGGSGMEPPRGRSRRRALPSNFTAVVTPVGKRRKRIRIRCTEDCGDLELRLVVDDRADVTTDRLWPDRVARIENAKINGVQVPPDAVTAAQPCAVRLGRLKKDTTTEIEVEYVLDGEGVPVRPDAGMRVEIGAPRPDPSGGDPSE